MNKETIWHTLPKTHAPPQRFLYLTETKIWRCERRRGGGENVHLLTHTTTLVGVGKNAETKDNQKILYQDRQSQVPIDDHEQPRINQMSSKPK